MNSRRHFEHRANTKIIPLSDVTQEFSEPERLRLQLSTTVVNKPIDIGSWAYFSRVRMKASMMIAVFLWWWNRLSKVAGN